MLARKEGPIGKPCDGRHVGTPARLARYHSAVDYLEHRISWPVSSPRRHFRHGVLSVCPGRWPWCKARPSSQPTTSVPAHQATHTTLPNSPTPNPASVLPAYNRPKNQEIGGRYSPDFLPPNRSPGHQDASELRARMCGNLERNSDNPKRSVFRRVGQDGRHKLLPFCYRQNPK